jgi:hypothetical protein
MEITRVFLVTKEWLHANASSSLTTSWTIAQRHMLNCPTVGPWINAAIGKLISEEQKAAFEQLGRERRLVNDGKRREAQAATDLLAKQR